MSQHPDTIRLQHMDLRVKQLEARVRELEAELFDLKSKSATSNTATVGAATTSA